MTVLRVFDLDDTADERALKRAYAERLRTTRPDDDALAFQKLRTSYQAALIFVRQRDSLIRPETSQDLYGPGIIHQAPLKDRASNVDRNVSHGYSNDADEISDLEPSTKIRRFEFPISHFGNVDHAARQIIEVAKEMEKSQFSDWLNDQIFGLILPRRHSLANEFLLKMGVHFAYIPLENVEIACQVFGFWDVNRPFDAQLVMALHKDIVERRRYEAAYRISQLLLPSNRHHLIHHISTSGSVKFGDREIRAYAFILCHPLSGFFAITLRWFPHLSASIRLFLEAIDEGNLEALDGAIKTRTINLWYFRKDDRPSGVINFIRAKWEYIFGFIFAMIALGMMESMFQFLSDPARHLRDVDMVQRCESIIRTHPEIAFSCK